MKVSNLNKYIQKNWCTYSHCLSVQHLLFFLFSLFLEISFTNALCQDTLPKQDTTLIQDTIIKQDTTKRKRTKFLNKIVKQVGKAVGQINPEEALQKLGSGQPIREIAKEEAEKAVHKLAFDEIAKTFHLDNTTFLSRGDRSLSPLQKANAKTAKAIFENFTTGPPASHSYNTEQNKYNIQIDSFQRRQLRRTLDALYVKYPKVNKSNLQDFQNDILPNLSKLRVQSNIFQSIRPGIITIYPHQKVKYNYNGFCLDRGIPSAGSGEPVQLISAAKYFGSAEGLKIFKQLAKKYAENPTNKSLIQGFVWRLVHGTSQKIDVSNPLSSIKLITLAPQEQSFLNSSFGSSSFFTSYLNSRYLTFGTLYNSVGQKFGKQLGTFIDNIFNLPSNVPYYDYTQPNGVESALLQLSELPILGNSEVNEEYTLLAPNVAAKAIANHLSMQIEIVNNSDQSFLYDPTDYVGFSSKTTQPIGGVPTTNVDDHSEDDNWICYVKAGGAVIVVAGILYVIVEGEVTVIVLEGTISITEYIWNLIRAGGIILKELCLEFIEALEEGWVYVSKWAGIGAETTEEILMPGSKLIGVEDQADVRIVEGGERAAQSLWKRLLKQGAKPYSDKPYGAEGDVLVTLKDGTRVGWRTKMTKSPNTKVTIDVKFNNGKTVKFKFQK